MNAHQEESRSPMEAPDTEPRVERLDEVKAARRALEGNIDPVIDAAVLGLIAKVARFQDLWIEAEDKWREGAIKPWADELARTRDLLRAEGDDVERMLEALRLHYRENVMPVSAYCGAFEDWRQAMAENGVMPEVVEALGSLQLAIHKSNYLHRRLYQGDPHRTDKCPVHQGRWSGCPFPGSEDYECECVQQGNTTGWLPAKGDDG